MTAGTLTATEVQTGAPPPPHIGRRGWARHVVKWLALAVVLGFVAAVKFSTMGAEFAAIDDEEIVRMLGPDHRITVGEYVPAVLKWSNEHIGRFRPAYYATRITEAFVAGGSPRAWHTDRLLLALATATILFLTAEAFVGPVAAAVAGLMFFAGEHFEIWARLGPAETYSVPLAVAGVALVARALRRGRWRPADHAAGMALLFVAALNKENFVALPVALVGLYVLSPVLARLGVLPRRERWRVRDYAAAAGATLAIAFQVGMTILRVRRYGHVYGGEVSERLLTGAVAYFAQHLTVEGVWYMVPVVAAVVLLATRPRTTGAGRQGRLRDVGLLAAAVTTAALVILPPQLAFYATSSSALMVPRYQMPAWFFVPTCVVTGFWFIRRRLPAGWKRIVAYAPVVAATTAICGTGGMQLYKSLGQFAADARIYQGRVSRIVAMKQAHPEMPVVVLVDSPDYFEPVHSTVDYLNYYLRSTERRFLRVEGGRSGKLFTGTFAERLMEDLRGKSAQGEGVRFRPLAELPPGPCITVLYLTGPTRPHSAHMVDMLRPSAMDTSVPPQFAGVWADDYEGLDPIEGPYPQWNLPYVRWGFAPATRLTVYTEGAATYVLRMKGAPAADGQSMTVLLNGNEVKRIPLGKPWVPVECAVPLRLLDGANRVDVRYDGVTAQPTPGLNRVRTVLFRRFSLNRVEPKATEATGLGGTPK